MKGAFFNELIESDDIISLVGFRSELAEGVLREFRVSMVYRVSGSR